MDKVILENQIVIMEALLVDAENSQGRHAALMAHKLREQIQFTIMHLKCYESWVK